VRRLPDVSHPYRIVAARYELRELMDTKRPSAELPLDHALLIAGVAVSQASTSTAMLAERMAQQPRPPVGDSLGALVELFVDRDAGAAEELHGSFHPRLASASAGRARTRLMKAGFTLAF
jgi:hypothetical protein